VRFRGDAVTDATLTDGPITDINLMVRRKEADGEMSVVSELGLVGRVSIVVAVGGTAGVKCDEAIIDLGPHDAMLDCDSEDVSLISGTVCVIWVKYL